MYGIWEGRIKDAQQTADRAAGRLHELDSLRSDVASLERANEGLSSCVDGLRYAVEACLQRIENLEIVVARIEEPLS